MWVPGWLLGGTIGTPARGANLCTRVGVGRVTLVVRLVGAFASLLAGEAALLC